MGVESLGTLAPVQKLPQQASSIEMQLLSRRRMQTWCTWIVLSKPAFEAANARSGKSDQPSVTRALKIAAAALLTHPPSCTAYAAQHAHSTQEPSEISSSAVYAL